MASIKTFVDEVAALTVADVTRAFTYPPRQITTADLPASWVELPSTTNNPVATCNELDDTFTVTLVVAVEAAGQDRNVSNWPDMLTMMDNLNTALKNQSTFTDMLRQTWTLQAQDTQPIIIASTAYWGVSATITAQGAN